PGDVLLALGEAEAAVNETCLAGVELAELHRIAAAVGEGDQAAGLGGLQAGRAVEEPVAAFRFGERVQVEQRAPLRARFAVGGQARMPPDAVRALGVLPKVVHA